IVNCSGGGGIPVYVEKDGTYEGVDAVIDKDLAAAILARNIKAEELYILTAVEKVALNFRKPDEIQLDKMTVQQARQYLEDGQFPEGSMGPKIQAAINFIEEGGKEVVISSIEKMTDAAEGKTGTKIVA
ncbi:carbamate kinase, partial [candidate division KSB1 bacterium]|nr:carbamate kinase [candidate division KSB1 bacterium]